MLRNMFKRLAIRLEAASRISAACLLAAVALGLCGCETTPRTSPLNQALSAYATHQYGTAHHYAVLAMRSGSERQRDQATYLAGLCAYLLEDLDEAELRLTAASRSSDRRAAGSAKAMLGQVRLDQNRAEDAARLFEEAAQQLTGADAVEAARFAALAHEYSGNQAAVDRWAAGSTSRPSSSSAGFALQVGAFHDRQRASSAADAAATVAERNGLGPVNVISSSDSRGRPLYVVQFGSFASRTSAAQTRAQLGRLDYIVAPRSMN